MTESERLTELIMNTPKIPVMMNGRAQGRTYQTARNIADHLLANGVIVPPCKVGDTVYYLTTVDTAKELNVSEIFDGVVQAIGFDGKDIWISVRYTNGLFYYHSAKDFSKTVFLTREEAEKALEERYKHEES